MGFAHPLLHPAARSPAQGGDLTGRGLPFTQLLGGPRRAAAPDGHKELLLEGSMGAGWNTQRSGVSLQAAYETCSPETPAPEQNALAAAVSPCGHVTQLPGGHFCLSPAFPRQQPCITRYRCSELFPRWGSHEEKFYLRRNRTLEVALNPGKGAAPKAPPSTCPGRQSLTRDKNCII